MKIDDSLGFLDFELNGESIRVDLFQLNDALAESLKDITEESPRAVVYEATKYACESCGLKIANAYVGVQVRNAVYARMAELRKKDLEAESAG